MLILHKKMCRTTQKSNRYIVLLQHRIKKPENQPIFCYIYQKLKYLAASFHYYPQQYISTEFSATTEHLQYIDINL